MKIIRFICVDFNNPDYTKKFCESLRLQSELNFNFSVECIIIDNSTNVVNSREIEDFSGKYSWINYIRAPNNLGYFGGLNLGLSTLGAVDTEVVVISNNDLTFDAEFCNKIINKTYGTNVFAVCPDVVTSDGRHQNPHVLKKISWLRRLQFDLYFTNYFIAKFMVEILRVVRPVKSSPPQPPDGCEIHMGIGACYVLTSEFLKRFKKLNYPHFLYGEEAYFSDQIHSAGGILWFDPDLRVHHAESASFSNVPKRTAYEFARNGYPSYRKMI